MRANVFRSSFRKRTSAERMAGMAFVPNPTPCGRRLCARTGRSLTGANRRSAATMARVILKSVAAGCCANGAMTCACGTFREALAARIANA